MKKIPQDIIGDIAILKFPKKTLLLTKKIKARKFLKENNFPYKIRKISRIMSIISFMIYQLRYL